MAVSPAAVQCTGVDVDFPVAGELGLWKLLRGSTAGTRVVRALSDVSLKVPRGVVIGVMGRNGAGKSTLLRVLGGIVQPSRGTVQHDGTIVGLFELGGLGSPNLSGREYAIRFLKIMDAPAGRLEAMLADIKSFAELEDAFDRPIRTYSTGMAARLYFATATAQQYDIYLIDELLAVGDEHFQTKCHERIRERLTNGASGVLVTHDWSAVIRLCAEAHVLDRGRVRFTGASDRAVVEYLGIERPAATQARFCDLDAAEYVATSGQDAELRFIVEVIDPIAVEIAASIEMMRVGSGWEILLLSQWSPAGDRTGRWQVRVRVPRLPLAPGQYSLNVFLRTANRAGDERTILDLRSWTAGNGLTLRVVGEPCDTPVRLPFRICDADDLPHDVG